MASPSADAAETALDEHCAPPRARPIKRLAILISILPGLALFFIAAGIALHISLPSDVTSSPPPSPPTTEITPSVNDTEPINPEEPEMTPKEPTPQPKPKKIRTVIKTEKVLVPPNQQDLDAVLRELETSDPLSPIADHEEDEELRDRAKSISSSFDLRVKERDVLASATKREYASLDEVYNSFESRWGQDLADSVQSKEGISENNNKFLEEKTKFLKLFLKRNSFWDLDRGNATEWFRMAREDVNSLLQADTTEEGGQVFFNMNGALLNALINNDPSKDAGEENKKGECQLSYLTLDGKPHSPEFNMPIKPILPPKPKLNKKKKKKRTAPVIPEGTARESHLYHRVTEIKNILSRRDLSTAEINEDGSFPSPLGSEGTAALHARLASMTNSLRTKRERNVNQAAVTKRNWEVRAEKALGLSDSIGAGGEDGTSCASTEILEHLMMSGLEALRQKEQLRSALLKSLVELLEEEELDSEDDEWVALLIEKIQKMDALVIDFDNKMESDHASSKPSSRRIGRKSLYYTVDGPLLHKGIVGGIDYFADLISGYNDNLDSIMDFIVGEDGVSLGTTAANAASKLVRKIPFPHEYFDKVKKSGVLAGRTRIWLD